MGKIKLIITDLDGTFLDNNGEPNQKNVQAIKSCKEAGIPVCVITARSFSSSLRVFGLAGIDGYCVTSNGASLYDIASRTQLYKQTIPKSGMKIILDTCVRHHASLFVIARGANAFCTQLKRPMMHTPKPVDIMQWPEEHRPFRVEVETATELLDWLQDESELINMHAPDEQKGFDGEFYRQIIGAGELTMTSSHPGGLDVMANGVSKTSGAQMLADRMGVKPEEVMACGDHLNDIGMLKWAGIGVAMGDAQPQTKLAADFISVDHDKGGVAQAIHKYVL